MEKLSLRTLDVQEMERIDGGTSAGCSWATGAMCFATLGLLSSVFLAPIAAATGIGCALGIASGCAS
jgi:hypothetical protein